GVEKGILPVKLITDVINETRPEKKQLTPQRIGRLLNSLGFDKGRASDGARALVWDERKISLLKARYGVNKTSVTSDRSETPGDSMSEA
ncbi:MAG TPA: hypothetical protein ACFYD2_10015, partial [Candidatus Avalokitesvara rifleensis]|uniref:hypothetical protein n=1 Tax=Candidatus Avalokitesvara rifleensis TaxID=3367620 RepID=UPI00402787E1